jgi:hypothetical protein
MELGRIMEAQVQVVHTDIEYSGLKKSHGHGGKEEKLYTLEEAEAENLKVVPWDGQ